MLKNLVICSPQLGISPNSVLGGEVCDREILRGIAKKGVRVEIILPEGKPHSENIQRWHITFTKVPHAPAILYNFIFLPYIFDVYRRSKFKILRVHSPRFIGLSCLVFKFFFPKVKIVANYHNFWETNFLFLSSKINNLWDHIITDSVFVKNKISKSYNIHGAKITAIYNGVTKEIHQKAKNQDLIKKLNLEGKVVLLFVGLLIRRKNPLFLIEVFARVLRKQPNTVLIYLGEGPLKQKIIARAQSMGILGSIRFVGPVFGRDKNDMFNISDIFVHPSIEEGFALAPLEAMACGKPVLITNGYSAPEQVIHQKNGYLCKINNINDWTSRILALSSKHLRKKMGFNSLKIFKEKFSWQIAADMHVSLFNKIIQ